VSKYVLVTGASKGIGRAITLDLDKRGYTVFAGVRKDDDANDLKSVGSERLYPVKIDVTNTEQIALTAAQITEVVGASGLDGAVNNAGLSVAGVLEHIPLDDFRYQLEVNLIGQLAVTQAVLPMIRQARGRVINMGSAGGSRLVMPGMGAYSVSKVSLEMLTDGLRVELKQWGVEVVSVLPGAVKTPIWESGQQLLDNARDKMSDEAMNDYGRILRRLEKFYAHSSNTGIDPQQVADAVYRALTDTKPKTRYYVGSDTWRFRLLSLLPDRLIDKLILG